MLKKTKTKEKCERTNKAKDCKRRQQDQRRKEDRATSKKTKTRKEIYEAHAPSQETIKKYGSTS